VATIEEVIADRFAAVLREWLTADEWTEMLERNGAQRDPLICHSHDFCDANMAMDQAFTEFAPEMKVDDVVAEDSVPVWNAAWDIAMVRHLRAMAPLHKVH